MGLTEPMVKAGHWAGLDEPWRPPRGCQVSRMRIGQNGANNGTPGGRQTTMGDAIRDTRVDPRQGGGHKTGL